MSAWRKKQSNELSAVQQYLRLKRDFPEGAGSVSMGKLIWRQQMKPTSISNSYLLRIVHTPPSSPRIYVEKPCLTELAAGRKLPHVYKQVPHQLCLYRQTYKEWLPSMFVSETILPWASLWLFYFEDWLITDEWKGGGEHPEEKKEELNSHN
jgi:hypothetical protein